MEADEMHRSRTRVFPFIASLAAATLMAVACLGAPLLRAQQPPDPRMGTDGGQTAGQDAGQAAGQAAGQNPGQPARAVRLSYVDGTVHLAMDGRPVTDKAVVNSPLFQGMTLSTADDGRAEIQFDDGSVARLSPDTSLTLTVLSGDGPTGNAEMTLDRGLAYFELQGTGQIGQVGVHFGDAAVTGSGFTVFRVRDDTPPGDLAVFSGNAHVDRGGGLSLDLHGGESVSFNAADSGSYNLAESIDPDSWDAWNSDRDQELTEEAATQSPAANSVAGGDASNPAWSDLNANGTWYNVPDQGYVWSPYDAASPGFDPYGNGNWVMTPGYGYTWASAYSWGYMPYQCGMWNFYGGFGWGWAPGMGGCSPWWNTGFYGGPFIGFAPGWYHPVHRPIVPRPGRPGGGPGGGLGGVIPVARHPQVMSAGLPARDRNTPVEIAGNTVMPIRSLPARSAYGSAWLNGGGSRFYSNNGRAAYGGSRAGYAPGYAPYARSGAGGSIYAPAPRYSGPAGAPGGHASSGGGYRGGGGGGGSHGGGGGGGSHGGGGGGGK